MERRLAAILAADVVGYSRLMAADEKGTHARLKSLRQDFIEPMVAEHKGRIVKLMGDGALVEFASVVDAVECAVVIQQGVAERQAEFPENQRIVFRIGLTIGDIIVEDNDIHGDGVNVAARLEAIAEPGGISISRNVAEQIRGKLDVFLEDTGVQELKNIDRPVEVFRVRAASTSVGSAIDVSQPVPGFDGRPAIAVLPFDNLSQDPDQEFFADGIAEDILTRLAMWRWLPVIARNSSFTFKGRVIDVKEIGRRLGARYVLEGSVRKAGGRVRVSGQLIDTDTGHHVWAQHYDGKLDDIFDLQDQTTDSIVAALEPAVGRAEMQRARRKNPESLGAWDLYQRGMFHLNKVTKDEIAHAREQFQRAVELDPGFASAHAGLALVGWFDVLLNLTEDLPGARSSALAAAKRAVALDDLDPFAQSVLAYTCTFQQQYEAGVTAARRAVELNPSFALGYHSLGVALTHNGQPHEAIEAEERAIRISPSDPWLFMFLAGLAGFCFFAREYDKAVAAAEMSVRRHPEYAPSRRWLAAALAQLDRYDEARDALAKFLELSPDYTIDSARHTLPFRHEADLEHLLDALRKAGLPE
jgi:adenylate cyclase